jgi:flagellar biosynthetic protein FlhB
VLSLTIAAFLSASQSTLLGSFRAEPGGVATLLIENLMALMWWVLAIAVVIAGIDWFWQQFDHRRKLMMSRQDILDEAKNAEGDPHLKQARRQRGYDIATQRMMADVPTADVVIVNPQHFAVALKWDRDSDRAPVCVAKGVDEIAARIREIAAEAAVPIHRDAPTARALFATVPIGDEIPQDHYKAVAAAIRFAEKVRSGAKRRNQT